MLRAVLHMFCLCSGLCYICFVCAQGCVTYVLFVLRAVLHMFCLCSGLCYVCFVCAQGCVTYVLFVLRAVLRMLCLCSGLCYMCFVCAQGCVTYVLFVLRAVLHVFCLCSGLCYMCSCLWRVFGSAALCAISVPTHVHVCLCSCYKPKMIYDRIVSTKSLWAYNNCVNKHVGTEMALPNRMWDTCVFMFVGQLMKYGVVSWEQNGWT